MLNVLLEKYLANLSHFIRIYPRFIREILTDFPAIFPIPLKFLCFFMVIPIIILIFVQIISKHMMEKKIKHKTKSIFQKVLEDKRAIRDCIQKGGDVKQLAKERGIQFVTPL